MASTLTIEPESPASLRPRTTEWIYGPWTDMLAGCGGWSAPLLLLAFYATTAHSQAWSAAFYFLALLFNYPHFMATVYRAYHTYSEFQKYRIITVHIALLLALAGILAHLWYPLLPWIFTLYICWSPWHYTGQNFGLLMMFARRSGLAPSTAERNAIHLSFIASFILLMLSFHTGSPGDPLILSLGLSAKFTLPARGMLALFFVGASGWALFSMARRSSLRAILAPLTLAVTQFLWFLLPVLIELFSGREVPQTRYSSGILAVLHSVQYLWITSYYQEREARAAGDVRWSISRYLLTLVTGGISLFIPGPWIASRLFHADFAASFLTFTALVNIHHFILDGALWKLRDSRVAAFLVHAKDNSEEASEDAQSGLRPVTRWLTGPTTWARTIRIATAGVLLAWAAMDQLHFYWSSKADNVPALQRAARLNPDDSSVEMRLAHAETLAGNGEASLAAMQRAASINPHNLALQEAYAKGLIEAGRTGDAYTQYEKILERWPRKIDALVNHGLLAQRLGKIEEAIENCQLAISIDPAQAQPQLYLAQALEHRGEAQAAARHYRAYLQIVAGHPEEHRGESATIVAVLIKVADAAAVDHSKDALTGYTAAIRFATKTSDRALKSLGLVRRADLEEKLGNAVAAAQDYQQALNLDAALADPLGAATDWLNYGQFLHRQRQPERLAFACMVHAEELAQATPGAVLRVIADARSKSEIRLGREAAAVLRNNRAVLKEALALPTTAFSQTH